MEAIRGEIGNQIELGMGFEELTEKLNDREQIKSGKQVKKLIDKKSVRFYRQFKRKAGPNLFSGKSGYAISKLYGELAISFRKENRRFLTILGNVGIGAISQNIGSHTNECWETLSRDGAMMS